jgi:hypothetical protein
MVCDLETESIRNGCRSNHDCVVWGIYRNISTAWSANNSISEVENLQVFVDDQLKETVGTDVMRYDLYGLPNNTVFTFQVKATLANTSSAEPPLSNVITTSTLNRTAPAAPETPKQLAVKGGFVQVSVKPPMDTGGANLASVIVVVRRYGSSYVVSRQSLPPDNAALLTYNVYGLDAGTTYQISSLAVNDGDLTSLESARLEITTMQLQLPDPCPPPKVLSSTGALYSHSVDLHAAS